MELTITLDHGPLDAEFTGEDREEIEKNLLKFIDFLEENQDSFGKVTPSQGTQKEAKPEQAQVTQFGDAQEGEKPRGDDGKFADLAERARVNQRPLEEFLNVPSDEEKVPYLRLGCFEEEEEVLGSARYEKQARASLILCYLWQHFRDVDEVESSDLNEGLHISGVNPKSRKNMYKGMDGSADGYFTRDSSGTVGLTQSGEIAAVDEITRLAEKLQGE